MGSLVWSRREHDSRLEILPVDNVLRHVLYRVLQEEPVRVPVHPLVSPFLELDAIAGIAKLQMWFVLWDFTQAVARTR